LAANNTDALMTPIPEILRNILPLSLASKIHLTIFNIFDALKRGVNCAIKAVTYD
jgi:hypothetical protein